MANVLFHTIMKILPLSIWLVIAPFIASMLASNRRSSSFSFLPKKTMITTFSFVCPEYKTISDNFFDFDETLLQVQFWSSHYHIHTHIISHISSITFFSYFCKVVIILSLKYYFTFLIFLRRKTCTHSLLEIHEIKEPCVIINNEPVITILSLMRQL